MTAYTALQIADLLKLSERAIQKRAHNESWISERRKGRGGGRIYPLESLPADVRIAIAARTCPAKAECPAPARIPSSEIKGQARDRMQVKMALLSLYRSFAALSGLRETPARSAFAARWNAGELDAEPWIRAALPTVSAGTLRNWDAQAKAAGPARLAGNYGHRRKTGLIDTQPEVQEVILGLIAEYPHISAQLIHEGLMAFNRQRRIEGLPEYRLPSMRRVQHWVAAWKEAHPGEMMHLTAPDGWKGRRTPSFGDIYAGVFSLNQRWEYDGTPADLMLADNKRYTIVGIIDVYSRRLKLEVAPTSTAMVVANLTRRCILDWGIPMECVTDNGKEFVSRHMQSVFLGLGIHLEILPPFRPELKPAIERAFRSFSHHLLTLAPCYVGHNVATRQQIRERETFAKRLMDKKDTAELSIALSPEELQVFCDQWTDAVHAHRKHSGLHGKTPFEMVAGWTGEVPRVADERALDVLLTPLVTNDGWRTVGKKGVSAPGGLYIAAELGVLVGERVQVRVDPRDTRYAYIFDNEERFVCRAENVNGMAADERRSISVSARKLAEKGVKKAAVDLRKLAKKTNAADAAKNIMEYHLERAKEIESQAGPKKEQAVELLLPELSAAARAAESAVPQQTITPDQAEAARRKAKEILAGPEFMVPSTPSGRDKLYHELLGRESAGEEIGAEAYVWMKRYAKSPEAEGYAAMRELLGTRGGKITILPNQ